MWEKNINHLHTKPDTTHAYHFHFLLLWLLLVSLLDSSECCNGNSNRNSWVSLLNSHSDFSLIRQRSSSFQGMKYMFSLTQWLNTNPIHWPSYQTWWPLRTWESNRECVWERERDTYYEIEEHFLVICMFKKMFDLLPVLKWLTNFEFQIPNLEFRFPNARKL